MGKWIYLMTVAVMSASLWAGETFLDDFNRVDTQYDQDGADVGVKWRNRGPVKWALQNEILAADHNVSGEYVLFNRSMEVGADVSFELSGEVVGMFGGAWAGVVFDYQDAGNFYAVRLQVGTSTYQFVRIVNGRISAAVSKKDAIRQFAVGAAYTIKVMCDAPKQFGFEITETGDPAVLNPTTIGRDHDATFKDGFAGFYVRSASGSAKPDALFDNFSLTTK